MKAIKTDLVKSFLRRFQKSARQVNRVKNKNAPTEA